MACDLNLNKALIKKIIFTATEPFPLWRGGMARATILIFCSLKNCKLSQRCFGCH